MAAVTDFHTHILPGVDDGSGSVEESIALLRQEAKQGIRYVAATPHFYANYDSPEAFLARRSAAAAALQAQLSRNTGLPRVILGAEVSYFRGMSESEQLPLLTIGGRRCILIEMPPAPWPEEVYRELREIREKQDLVPVLAHIERYLPPFRTGEVLRRLEKLPVLVQANGSFFLERSTSALAMRMLQRDQIHLLGSDCHNMTHRRPNLGQALERIREKLGEEPLQRIRSYEKQIFSR